jgi:hypothetical protein
VNLHDTPLTTFKRFARLRLNLSLPSPPQSLKKISSRNLTKRSSD